MSVSEKVRIELEPILLNEGIELFDVSFKKEGKDYFLRILISRINDDYLDLDSIVSISEKISQILDEKDLINSNYMLDVASAGAERPIKIENLEKYISKYINLKLTDAVEGLIDVEGDLVNVDENAVTIKVRIKTKEKNIVIEKSNITKARVAIKF